MPVPVVGPEPSLCKLRAELVNLEPEDQSAMILTCHIANMAATGRLIRDRRTLINWIEVETSEPDTETD